MQGDYGSYGNEVEKNAVLCYTVCCYDSHGSLKLWLLYHRPEKRERRFTL